MVRVLNGQFETLADLLHHLGDIPPRRVRLKPPPGTATQADLIKALNGTNKVLCELIDGTLVEKAVGAQESFLAAKLIRILGNFIDARKLGAVFGSDAPFRILPRRVRLPDVSFVSWNSYPEGEVPTDPIARVIPELVIEVVSKGNTKKEMKLKLREYFRAGVQLVWEIYPKTRSAKSYTALDQVTHLGSGESLTGGEVLKGFRLPLAELFEEVGRPKGKQK